MLYVLLWCRHYPSNLGWQPSDWAQFSPRTLTQSSDTLWITVEFLLNGMWLCRDFGCRKLRCKYTYQPFAMTRQYCASTGLSARARAFAFSFARPNSHIWYTQIVRAPAKITNKRFCALRIWAHRCATQQQQQQQPLGDRHTHIQPHHRRATSETSDVYSILNCNHSTIRKNRNGSEWTLQCWS